MTRCGADNLSERWFIRNRSVNTDYGSSDYLSNYGPNPEWNGAFGSYSLVLNHPLASKAMGPLDKMEYPLQALIQLKTDIFSWFKMVLWNQSGCCFMSAVFVQSLMCLN